MPSIPINNLTNRTDINGQELLPFVRDGKTYRCSMSSVFFNNAVTQPVISNGAVTPSKLSTGGPSWSGTGAAGVFTVPQTGLEFGTGHTQDYNCFIDLHTAATPTDFETRIIRDGGANGSFRILNRGTNHIILSTGGYVGIGTATPVAKLEVTGSSIDDSLPELRISGSSGNISSYVSLCAGFYNPIVLNQDKGIIFTGGTVNTGNLVIAPHATSTSGIRMLSSGNVGIGKSTPTTTLDVNGTVTATGFSGPLTGTATSVSDGVITAAKLNGAQTGTAPIYGVRAWAKLNPYVISSRTGAYKTGTYSRTATETTVSIVGHGLKTNDKIRLNFTSGSGNDGLYTVTSSVDADTFVVNHTGSVTSGSVQAQFVAIQAAGNISSASFYDSGDDRVVLNFTIPMPDDDYVTIVTGQYDPGSWQSTGSEDTLGNTQLNTIYQAHVYFDQNVKFLNVMIIG